MELIDLTKSIALYSLIFSISLLLYRLVMFLRYPKIKDYSEPKGSSKKGVIYSFTIGMAPWTKESTRKHWIIYLRGIFFHLGIFSAILIFLIRLLLHYIPEIFIFPFTLFSGIGALMGLIGIVLRMTEKNLKVMSNWDDHISLWIVSAFLIFTTLSSLLPPTLPLMFFISSLMLIYIPFSKIRHFLYFYFSRLFLGYHIGKRGIVKKWR